MNNIEACQKWGLPITYILAARENLHLVGIYNFSLCFMFGSLLSMSTKCQKKYMTLIDSTTRVKISSSNRQWVCNFSTMSWSYMLILSLLSLWLSQNHKIQICFPPPLGWHSILGFQNIYERGSRDAQRVPMSLQSWVMDFHKCPSSLMAHNIFETI